MSGKITLLIAIKSQKLLNKFNKTRMIWHQWEKYDRLVNCRSHHSGHSSVQKAESFWRLKAI
jgi:hypothetical protein